VVSSRNEIPPGVTAARIGQQVEKGCNITTPGNRRVRPVYCAGVLGCHALVGAVWGRSGSSLRWHFQANSREREGRPDDAAPWPCRNPDKSEGWGAAFFTWLEGLLLQNSRAMDPERFGWDPPEPKGMKSYNPRSLASTLSASGNAPSMREHAATGHRGSGSGPLPHQSRESATLLAAVERWGFAMLARRASGCAWLQSSRFARR